VNRRPARAPDPEERRKLFRRMEWVFVYAPPLLILLVAGSGATLLAWIIPVGTLGFWTKWLIGVVLLIGLPLLAYLIHGWRNR
jgi:hypothetical protein